MMKEVPLFHPIPDYLYEVFLDWFGELVPAEDFGDLSFSMTCEVDTALGVVTVFVN